MEDATCWVMRLSVSTETSYEGGQHLRGAFEDQATRPSAIATAHEYGRKETNVARIVRYQVIAQAGPEAPSVWDEFHLWCIKDETRAHATKTNDAGNTPTPRVMFLTICNE